MKKLGFTLAELLITMAVISLVATMIMPLIGSLFPDENKGKVLKVYKTINDINKELLGDPGYNFVPEPNGTSCKGIDCEVLPLDPVYGDSYYQNESKYVNLFVKFLELREEIENKYHYGDTEFYTIDGIKWKTSRDEDANYFITIDLDDSSNSKNCKYNKDQCPNPDQFEFFVSVEGIVFPNDALTNAYIKNSTKLNDKKADFKMAKEDTTEYKE